MSYQLHCPNCSTMIPPENINVQKVIAVCPNCAAVFNFADTVASGQKIKRRKSKKPDHITHTETDDSLVLEMPFLQTIHNKIGVGVLGVVIIGLYAMILIGILTDPQLEIAPLVILSLIFLPIVIGAFGSLFARQTVEVNTEELKHEVRLGMPVYHRKMPIEDIVDVTAEEMSATRESIAEARYNLYAEKYDGRQDMFIQNLPEEMATYTQQALSNYLATDDADSARLSVQSTVSDDDLLIVEEQQQNHTQQM